MIPSDYTFSTIRIKGLRKYILKHSCGRTKKMVVEPEAQNCNCPCKDTQFWNSKAK